jgi:hypothetical protein
MPDVRLAYAPTSSCASLTPATAQSSPARTSSGRRSPSFSVHAFVPLAASLFESLHTAHEGARGSSRFGTLPPASSHPSASRLRISGITALLASPSIHGAAQARTLRRASYAQQQPSAALAQASAVPISCEPPRGTGYRVLPGPCSSCSLSARSNRQPNPGMQRTRYARR